MEKEANETGKELTGVLQREKEMTIAPCSAKETAGAPCSTKKIAIVPYCGEDCPKMVRIWNEVVADGVAFPQEEELTELSGAAFFASQTYCGVAKNEEGNILGLYILHPNNVGRCGHIANASFAVAKESRGLHIGEKLVLDCLTQAKKEGFLVMQFNAVVAGNTHARHLYERLGFVQLGTIPGGFRQKDGTYADICPYYRSLSDL